MVWNGRPYNDSQPRGWLPLHPVEVSEEGYAMIKEPWRETEYGHGYGICYDDQHFPTKCEHQGRRAAYKHLLIEPPEGATKDVYGHPLPLPAARKTFLAEEIALSNKL